MLANRPRIKYPPRPRSCGNCWGKFSFEMRSFNRVNGGQSSRLGGRRPKHASNAYKLLFAMVDCRAVIELDDDHIRHFRLTAETTLPGVLDEHEFRESEPLAGRIHISFDVYRLTVARGDF